MKNQQIDYGDVIAKYPWIVEKNHNAILSPDIDGLLCGLLMSTYLNWKIVGFYDGKNLLIKPGLSTKDCVFLDMEILRPDVRSAGHHLNVHMLSKPPDDYLQKMSNCINPNFIRGFDRAKTKLGRKYPLGAIHFLMYVLENKSLGLISVKSDGLAPIFFGDGVWKILFKYTANVLDWFDYLHSGAEAEWWKQLKSMSVIELIEKMDVFLAALAKIDATSYGHIPLEPFNPEALDKTLNLLARLTGWKHDPQLWEVSGLRTHKFTKYIYGQPYGSSSNEKFFEIWALNPLSLAMTNGAVIQYTVEAPDKLP